MRVVVTGNLGYVGPVLGRYLKKNNNNISLVGVDTGYFILDNTDQVISGDISYDKQYFSDIRSDEFRNVVSGSDALVTLAAISNDPMGNTFAKQTAEINLAGLIKNAKLAKERGVKRLIFASSCSVYGFGGDNPKTENDAVAPLTAYARSKIECEECLKELVDENFKVIALRFATACGVSQRTRLDLVLNDFVWNYLSKGEIKILSDGSPLRPLIDVQDMARAIDWALKYETKSNYLVMNCGYNQSNYSVSELAKLVSGGDLQKIKVNVNAEPDKRSYRVDFSLFEKLSGFSSPLLDMQQSITNLSKHFLTLAETYDGGSQVYERFKRLTTLKKQIDAGLLDDDLFWQD